jgi:hypothetical protein
VDAAGRPTGSRGVAGDKEGRPRRGRPAAMVDALRGLLCARLKALLICGFHVIIHDHDEWL